MKTLVLYVTEKLPHHENSFCLSISTYVRLHEYIYLLHVYMLSIYVCVFYS